MNGAEPAPGPGAGSRVAVIGAGIVGVCSALCLQRDGFRVTLIERDAPGQGASFGNGHCGMMLGARAGEIVASLLAERDPGLDMTPYRVARF